MCVSLFEGAECVAILCTGCVYAISSIRRVCGNIFQVVEGFTYITFVVVVVVWIFGCCCCWYFFIYFIFTHTLQLLL